VPLHRSSAAAENALKAKKKFLAIINFLVISNNSHSKFMISIALAMLSASAQH